jgi:archaellum component FlaF (FlaF/FlaG flagellin family)
MKRKEIFLIVVLIIFGLLYQLYKTGEEEVFEGCSTDSKYLLDKNHPHEFTGIISTFENIHTLDIKNLASWVSREN